MRSIRRPARRSRGPVLAAVVISAATILVVAPGMASAGDRPDADTRALTAIDAPAEATDAGDAAKILQTFDLSWWSVDGGGAESTGGSFTLTGAIGQPESGLASAGDEVLDAGLWSTVVDQQILFADGFEDGTTDAWDSVIN